ncbi:MAG: 2-amino-4-hydroxy-6-hydroxymethyldihydropteridine diphosphokinase [Bdellovibrionales bacterium]|nr:2-amino-4-hydroxy-6-hydroxymethyldihydropteridine diphosphokinase [Bdellovibrionales bacterium]
MNEKNSALISIKTFTHNGTAELKSVLQVLSKTFSVEAVSSVYKVNRRSESLQGLRDIKKEEHLEALAIVLKVKSDLGAREVLEALNDAEQTFQREQLKRTVSLNLLAFNSEVIMLPGLAVPHPEMHLRPEEIIPAVEVWPQYIHPVLNLSLSELSRKFAGDNWGEFFTQGQPLLDF